MLFVGTVPWSAEAIANATFVKRRYRRYRRSIWGKEGSSYVESLAASSHFARKMHLGVIFQRSMVELVRPLSIMMMMEICIWNQYMDHSPGQLHNQILESKPLVLFQIILF